ncbi:MAG: hypothetical protein HWN68_03730 [Desulfobacterales bacterium]|nr:hypothetical protein [Desulfobacterales bacterium]
MLKSSAAVADIIAERMHKSKMENLLFGIQHRINPLHVYCRLVERGMNKPISLSISRYYEILVFSWLNWLLILVILASRLKR